MCDVALLGLGAVGAMAAWRCASRGARMVGIWSDVQRFTRMPQRSRLGRAGCRTGRRLGPRLLTGLTTIAAAILRAIVALAIAVGFGATVAFVVATIARAIATAVFAFIFRRSRLVMVSLRAAELRADHHTGAKDQRGHEDGTDSA